MKNTLFTSIIAGTVALAAGQADAQMKVRGVSKNEVIIGMQTDLSGIAAAFGVNSSNGARMRIDEVNAAGGVQGRKIKLIVEDGQYQVPRAVQAANKLINRDNIFLMLQSAGTPMTNAILPDLIKANVPNLFPLTGARSMYEPVHPLKFAGGLAPYYPLMRGAVKYFAANKGRKNICSMYQDTDYGKEVFEGISDEAKASGLKIIEVTTHKPADTDFTAPMAKLRAANCEAIFLGSIIRDAIIPFGTARRMGWDVDMVGSSAIFELAVAAQSGATDGLYAMAGFEAPYADSPLPSVAQWVARYKAKYNADPSPSAQIGYTTADLTILALDRAGANPTVESFVKGMESISGYSDLFGGPIMSFSASKHLGTDQGLLMQVQKSRWVRVAGPL